jgi:phosphate acetyltransferase
MEPQSGKSVVLLGIMEMLSRRIQNIGIFRPIVRAGEKHDDYIDLVRKRYKLKFDYEDLYACTHQEARDLIGSGQYNTLVKRMVDKYKELEKRCDFVVCVGTDFTGVATAFEFHFTRRQRP